MIPPVDVAVVGGGVIGCSVAYQAARRGARVALFEAEQIGSGASEAAAGMLAAQTEAAGPGPFLDLLMLGRNHHRKFGEEIYESSGLDPEYIWDGMLRIASEADSRETLHVRYSWQKEEGLSARWIGAGEARELEPALSPDISAALYLPDEGQVNSPRLVRSLAAGAASLGVSIMVATRATGFLTNRRMVTGLETTQGKVSAGTVVLAGGATSAALARKLGISLPVHPVQGDILAVNTGLAPIKSTVWGDRCYTVPKRDGRVVIGATEEPGIYDRRPTLGGVSRLSDAAINLIPDLYHAAFDTAWGGLRPGTPDGEPILGPVEECDNLLLATGHYRNGVLLSLITGEIISALAENEPPPVDTSPFLLDRFMEKKSSNS